MTALFKQIVVSILTWEARIVLSRAKPRIIAVTGSVGKTSTKDAIYAALARSLSMRKSEKSFNSEIGVPLTILGLDNAWNNPIRWLFNIIKGAALAISPGAYPAWLVLEVGADRPGDIRRIASWLRPDIAVYTGIPEIPVHVEYFPSPEALVREKRALAEYVKPGGTVIVNGDDAHGRRIHKDFLGMSTTYGGASDNDFFSSNEEVLYEQDEPIGLRFCVHRDGVTMPVEIMGALGRPRIYAALAAIAVGEAAGVDRSVASRDLYDWAPPPGRARILKGLKYSTILDDTYNSSPAAALAALDILNEIRTGGKKIVLMGDMLELGRYTKEAHTQVGVRAAQVADVLITVGFRSRAMAEAALDAGMNAEHIRQYELGESERAGEEVIADLAKGDIVLVKGSQGTRMEKAVRVLMAEPERAHELLVRMDDEWKNR